MIGGLSLKAYGLLIAIIQHNLRIDYRSLMEHFKEGERAILSGLKELRENGYLKTKTHAINEKYITYSRVTEKAEKLFFGLGLQKACRQNVGTTTDNEQIKQNNAYSVFISKPNLEAEPQEELEEYLKVSYEFFNRTSQPSEDSEDPMDRRIAAERLRKKDYENGRSKVFKSRFQKRHENPISKWSINDVCFEFADRLFQYWHIKPWSVTESAFAGALSTARKRLDTNSELEVACMDLFFKQVSISEYKDADILWKLFISRLPSLIGQARMMVTTDASKDVAEKAREKARKLLLGEDV